MATVTFTPAASSYTPKTPHTGVQTVYFEKTATNTGGWKDTYLAKIPHGARIIDGAIHGGGAALNDIRVGVDGTSFASSVCQLVGTASGSALVRFWNATNLDATPGFQVSVSDDAVNRWVYINVESSGSLAFSPLRGWISYLPPGDKD